MAAGGTASAAASEVVRDVVNAAVASVAAKQQQTEVVSAASAAAIKETASEAAQRLRGELGQDSRIVCILGGTSFQGAESEALVRAIAAKLGTAMGPKAKFVTGGMAGVQETFAKQCGDGSKVLNLLPVGQSSGFGRGTDINAGADLEERKAIFGLIGDVYITVEGGPGVSQEARAACAREAFVLPLIRTGGASEGMFNFPPKAVERPQWIKEEQWSLLKNKSAPVGEAAAVVADIVEMLVLPP
mmetsp:Transcript_110884/g.277554  ORF Transcript_110884/g.277554 Transcript_110884/m.277554 type:complete len:244 (+) Transcript_110884:100-831(+)